MANEFNIPPVVFPTDTRRRVPTPPFIYTPPSSSSLPFMSFDVPASISGNIATSSSAAYGAAASGNFEDEEPLLDELGIHPTEIWAKTKSALNPIKVNTKSFTQSDLSGPFLYYTLFAFFQLLSGKFQFGILLGWITIFSIFLYIVFNMLAGRNGNLDLHMCTSILGYAMLPLVMFSALNLFLPHNASLGLALVFVIWASRICARLVVEVSTGMEDHYALIVYPCFMIYTIMCMLIVF